MSVRGEFRRLLEDLLSALREAGLIPKRSKKS